MSKQFTIFSFLFLILLSYSIGKEYSAFDVVGDSISEGVNPDLSPTNYGWVDMLFGYGGGALPPSKSSTIYTLWSGITVYNDAHSGSRAIDWAADTNSWLTTVRNHHPDLVVVYIGGNDFLFYGIDGMISTTEQDQYRNNLRSIVSTLQSNTSVPDIVLGNYYDLFDGFSPSVSTSSTYQAFSYSVVTLNQIIQQVALEKGCYQVPIYTDFFHHCYGV